MLPKLNTAEIIKCPYCGNHMKAYITIYEEQAHIRIECADTKGCAYVYKIGYVSMVFLEDETEELF